MTKTWTEGITGQGRDIGEADTLMPKPICMAALAIDHPTTRWIHSAFLIRFDRSVLSTSESLKWDFLLKLTEGSIVLKMAVILEIIGAKGDSLVRENWDRYN